MVGSVYIGTSGWSYKHWMGTFYPTGTKLKDRFAYYLTKFDTVELNSPFYHLPPKQTFAKWKNEVAYNFVYAIKASRYITHIKKLNDPAESVEKFLGNASGLEEKLGIVLFQLPPRWEMDEERFANFLKVLPKGLRCTFEFRDASWYNDKIYALLREYNFAFCMYELAGHMSPPEVTADYIYIRLHGPGDKYQGSYTDDALKKWANRCNAWANEGKDVYIYFDNDQEGYAAFNAIRLKELL